MAPTRHWEACGLKGVGGIFPHIFGFFLFHIICSKFSVPVSSFILRLQHMLL